MSTHTSTDKGAEAERAAFEAWMKTRSGYPFAAAFANLMWTAWQAARRAPAPVADGLPPLPTLPRYLLDQIGEYGMARADAVGQIEVQYRWEVLISHIKRYAADYVLDAIAADRQRPKREMPPEMKAAIEEAHKTGSTSALLPNGSAVFINYGHDYGDNSHLECTACGGSGHIEDQQARASVHAAGAVQQPVAAGVKTWEARLVGVFGKIPSGGHVDREAAMREEIADLRAQLAQHERVHKIMVDTCRDLGQALHAAREMVGHPDNVAFITRAMATAGIKDLVPQAGAVPAPGNTAKPAGAGSRALMDQWNAGAALLLFKEWKGYPLPDFNSDGNFDRDWLHREWVAFQAGLKRRSPATSAAAQPVEQVGEQIGKRISDALNTTLWLYRRLPACYGNPPFVDAAIMAFADVLGVEAPEAIKERLRLHRAAQSNTKGATDGAEGDQ